MSILDLYIYESSCTRDSPVLRDALLNRNLCIYIYSCVYIHQVMLSRAMGMPVKACAFPRQMEWDRGGSLHSQEASFLRNYLSTDLKIYSETTTATTIDA